MSLLTVLESDSMDFTHSQDSIVQGLTVSVLPKYTNEELEFISEYSIFIVREEVHNLFKKGTYLL